MRKLNESKGLGKQKDARTLDIKPDVTRDDDARVCHTLCEYTISDRNRQSQRQHVDAENFCTSRI